MRVGGSHLSYCTNIHPGESWDEIRGNLERYLPQVKRRVSPDAPFGVGLRLSAAAAQSLGDPVAREQFAAFLRAGGPVRLHHQWLSVRALPRHARQGRCLPAGLARCAAARVHQPAGGPARVVAGARRRRRGQHQHRPRRVQAECADGRLRSTASSTGCCATRRTSSRSSGKRAGASCWRSSRSPAACSRRSPRPWRSSATTCTPMPPLRAWPD